MKIHKTCIACLKPSYAGMFLPVLLLFTCQSSGLLYVTSAEDQADIEITENGSPLIRSVLCDITAEPVDRAMWQKILKSSAYAARYSSSVPQRIPPLLFFHIIIKSTTTLPFKFERAVLRYGKTAMPQLTAGDIKSRLASPAYFSINVPALLTSRRLLAEHDTALKIDYDKETIAVYYDFIPPQDTMIFLIAFDRIQTKVRSYKLMLEMTSSQGKKIIEFHFNRHDYRTSGKIFIKKQFEKKNTFYDD